VKVREAANIVSSFYQLRDENISNKKFKYLMIRHVQGHDYLHAAFTTSLHTQSVLDIVPVYRGPLQEASSDIDLAFHV